ncbi:VWA domain-containing protein [Patescibacteria group bacterium]
MKNNIKILQIALVIFSALLFQGCSHENERAVSEKSENNGTCQDQYENIFNANKAELSDCKFSVRNDSFEKKDIPSKQNNTVLIFDASGSMAGLVDGRSKIDIAKDSIMKFVDQMQDTDVNLSIIVYGHKGSNNSSDKSISCKGIEEVYYLGEADSTVIGNKINPLRPTGWTPIADSFERAGEILSKYTGSEYNNSIILVSDGQETCDGNPSEIAEKLKKSNLKVVANVIGFDVRGDSEDQLREIAKIGGGDYFSVKNSFDFDNALDRHKAFLDEFEYKMDNISMQLQDISNFSDKYFECFMRLKKEEANIMLDIYADEDADEQCRSSVENKYYSDRYDALESDMKSKFDIVMREWKAANAFNE